MPVEQAVPPAVGATQRGFGGCPGGMRPAACRSDGDCTGGSARAAAEKNEYTAAAQVDPGRAKEVIPRGVVPSYQRGSEARIATGTGGSAVVLVLDQVVPIEQTAPCRCGRSGSSEHLRLRSAPVVLLVSVVSRQTRQLGPWCWRRWFRRPAQQTEREFVVRGQSVRSIDRGSG